ncbi:mpv17-like protein [Arctopsyche grandis]|uniref:mpv17-like protein n=1 Tax=Arctopsyche grandis TaxID=121162 RepID=UPI00406D78FC
MSKIILSLASFGTKIVAFSNRHPVCRGMVSYGAIWPTSCLIQQTINGKRWDTYDWGQCGRFALYGSCFTAPTLYLWVRLLTKVYPKTTFKAAVIKAVVEQVSYGPSAMICFFFGMSILEGRSIEQSVEEVKVKFWPTYKVGFFFWPSFQTINFYFIAEKNRVPFVSVCSLVWTIFLSYMKQLEADKIAKEGLLIS